jgi:hypothetical protein
MNEEYCLNNQCQALARRSSQFHLERHVNIAQAGLISQRQLHSARRSRAFAIRVVRASPEFTAEICTTFSDAFDHGAAANWTFDPVRH